MKGVPLPAQKPFHMAVEGCGRMVYRVMQGVYDAWERQVVQEVSVTQRVSLGPNIMNLQCQYLRHQYERRAESIRGVVELNACIARIESWEQHGANLQTQSMFKTELNK